MINAKGGLLGRKVELVIKDDASNQNTVVSDYNALISDDKVDMLLGTFSSLLNLPASAVAERAQMLYVEPAGGNPDIFKRGFKTIFFSQQATAIHQGDVVVELARLAARRQAPEDGRLPDARRPVRGPDVGRHRGHPREGRDQDRLHEDVHGRHEELRLDRRRGEGREPGPRRRRRAVRGRRRLPARAQQGRLHAEVALPDATRRRSATSTPRASAPTTPRASSTPSATARAPTRPATRSSSAAYQKMFGGDLVPEDAADAYAAASVHAGHGRGQQDRREGRPAQAGRLAAVEHGADDPRRPELERGRQPARASSSSASGRAASRRSCCRTRAKTSDKIIEGYKPGEPAN